MSDNWEYETKCRRCGKIEIRFFGAKDKTDQLDFYKTMNNDLVPRAQQCFKCNMNTVQDIVSYN